MPTIDLQPPRGTRDFPPEEMRLRTWLFDHFREVARLFAFEEYDAPVLESEQLFTRKAGEEIVGQLYNFVDKGDRKVALRPEMTPSLARLILGKGRAMPLPARWFSIPQCWRYERMTRGRKREHYQWNMDVFGVPGVEAEAELLAAIATFFQRVGLGPEDVGLKVNSRKVLQGLLEGLGVPADRLAPVCVLVDKLEKVPREAIEADLRALGLDASLVDRVVETMAIRDLGQLESVIGTVAPSAREAVADLRRLFDLLDAYGLSAWASFDASVVRGLAYYTGVVFEGFDRGATLRAVCGGGRYDRLLSTFGGEDIPACGFGFGDVVILELLADKGRLPTLQPRLDDVVYAFDGSLAGPARAVASQLRARGRAVDLVLGDRKPKWAFQHADRRGADRVVLLAPREWEQGLIRVKDLRAGTEQDLPSSQFLP